MSDTTEEIPAPDPTPEPDPSSTERDLSSPLDGDESRRDLVVERVGFRKWLLTQKRTGNPLGLEFVPLWGKSGLKWPVNYKFEEWADLCEVYYPDDDDIVSYMIRAEAAWRAEQTANEVAATSLGIAPQTLANKLSHRTGQTDDKCGLVFQDGKQCKHHVVPGSTRCVDHGGALVDPETRRAILLSTYATLVTSAQIAVDTLVDVAQNSRNDLARVGASKEILDRVGLTPDLNINVTVKGEGASPIDKLKSKLDEMSERLRTQPIDTTAVDADTLSHSRASAASESGQGPVLPLDVLTPAEPSE